MLRLLLLFCGMMLPVLPGQLHAAPGEPVVIDISQMENGLLARYTLPEAVAEFAFHEVLIDRSDGRFADLLRDDHWQVLDDRLVLSGGKISAPDGDYFSAFTLLIPVDREGFSRVSPALLPVGQGVIARPGWLAGGLTESDNLLRFSAAPGNFVFTSGRDPASTAEIYLTRDRYGEGQLAVFLGPEAYLQSGEVTLIAPPDLPGWTTVHVSEIAERSFDFFAETFGVIPARPPSFIFSYEEVQPGIYWRGDVARGGLITLQLRGAGWQTPTARLQNDLSLFIAHEVSHLWMGDLYRQGTDDSDSWLVEGAAEYFALRSLNRIGLLENAALDRHLTSNLNKCLTVLSVTGHAALMEGRAVSQGGEGLYQCGATIQWIAESAIRETSPQTDIFAFWSKIFSRTGLEGSFSPADFFAALEAQAPDSTAPAAIGYLLGRGGKVDDFPGLLAASGIDIGEAQTADSSRALIRQLIVPLMRENCLPPHRLGVRQVAGQFAIALQTGNRCAGSLSGDPTIIAVEGINLRAAPAAAYDAAEMRCALTGEVALETLEKGTVAVPCRGGLPARARQYTLTRSWAY